MILLEMIFLPKLRYTVAQQNPSVSWMHWTLSGMCHMELSKHQMRFHSISQRITYDSDWNRTSTWQYAILTLVRTLVRHQCLSGVSCRTSTFLTRTCPFSFHPLATDQMRTCTASVSSWLCASCICNMSISQTCKPRALGRFRTWWTCARPDI